MAEPRFVARERGLNQLQLTLDRALAGQGQVCFVTGEAGSGKTALVREFARRAQQTHPDLLVAVGNCNAQTGLGAPYLPFREVLGLLFQSVPPTAFVAEQPDLPRFGICNIIVGEGTPHRVVRNDDRNCD